MITLEIKQFRDIISRDNYTHKLDVASCNSHTSNDVFLSTMISTSGGCVIYCDNYFKKLRDGSFSQIMNDEANIEIGKRPVYIKNQLGDFFTNSQLAKIISNKFKPQTIDLHRYFSSELRIMEHVRSGSKDDHSETKTCSHCESRLFISSTDGVWCCKCNKFFKD